MKGNLMKKRKPQIQAKAAGRRFTIVIPPVEQWILTYQNWRVGKLSDGSFLIVDEWTGSWDTPGSVGWIARPHANFRSILKCGEYDHDFLRGLAHKLGIERLRWKNHWMDVDDYLADPPHTPEELKAYHLRTVVNLQRAGRWKAAVAYEREVEQWLQ